MSQKTWDPKEAIKCAIQKNRLAHAYLLLGPNLQELKKLSYWMAKLFICEGESKERPCEVCDTCRKIDRGVSPDVDWVEPQGVLRMIKITQIRHLQKLASFRPYEARSKILLVSEADQMNLQASNAFLKTLEEPSPQTIFILLATRLEHLMATIRSRCQLLRIHSQGDCLKQEMIDSDVPFREILLALFPQNGLQAKELVESGVWNSRVRLLHSLKEMLEGNLMIVGGVTQWLNYLDAYKLELEKKVSDVEAETKEQQLEAKAWVEGALVLELNDLIHTFLYYLRLEWCQKDLQYWPALVNCFEELNRLMKRSANRRWVFEKFVMDLRNVLEKSPVAT